jgi:hypothetical protein
VKSIVALAAACSALVLPVSSAAADPNLVGQWHFDEGGGTAVHDSSGHGNDGTVEGAAQWVAGRFGSALQFDGTTSRLPIVDNASLEPSAAVTVTAWFKHAGSPGDYRYIVAKGATDCIAASYGLYSGPNGGLQFYISMDHGNSYVRSPDAGLGVWDGQWHMAVGVYDGSVVRLFVDGHEVGSGTPQSGPLEYLLPNSNDLYIGDYPNCQLHHKFVGTIDEVSIRNAALNASEVLAAYDAATGQGSGGGQTGPGGPGGGEGTGSPSLAPAIQHLAVSPSAFAIDPAHGRRIRTKQAGATVSYTDTQAARSSFTVLSRQTGIVSHGKCVAATRHRHGRRCFFYKRLGTFTHADVAGRNSFHFGGLPGRRLAAGSYRLDATPRANGLVGRTISVRFTIKR